MDPSEYYYGSFRDHFRLFWTSLENHGSVSRVRMRLNPSHFAYQASEHFSVVDLVARPDQDLRDHLAEVPRDAHLDFLCGLLYIILIDQVMYSHRPAVYSVFRSMTRYPKMDRTVGYSRTLMMANPYELLDGEILASRGIQCEEVYSRFERWAQFIVDDLNNFFLTHEVGSTAWSDVRAAMLMDPDTTWSKAGSALARALAADSETNLDRR